MDIDNTVVVEHLLGELRETLYEDVFKHASVSRSPLGKIYFWKLSNGYGVSAVEFDIMLQSLHGRYELATLEIDESGEYIIDDDSIYKVHSKEEIVEYLEEVKSKEDRVQRGFYDVLGGIGNKRIYRYGNIPVEQNESDREKTQEQEYFKRDYSTVLEKKEEKGDYLILSLIDNIKVGIISNIMSKINSEYLYNIMENKLFDIRNKYIYN